MNIEERLKAALKEHKEVLGEAQRDNENLSYQVETLTKQVDILNDHNKKITYLKATNEIMKNTLKDIAEEDFRGNRSSGSVKAFFALKKVGEINE